MGIISGPIGKGLSLFKLKQATANADDVLKGVTFFSKDKILKTGTLELTGNAAAGDLLAGKTMYVTNAKSKITGTLTLSGNASAADLLADKTMYTTNAKSKITGTMVDRGNWGATLSPGGSVTIPGGKHGGSGKVTAKSLKTTEIWKYCGGGKTEFSVSGGTVVGISYAGNPYNGENCMQAAFIDGGKAYVQCAHGTPSQNIKVVLVYY